MRRSESDESETQKKGQESLKQTVSEQKISEKRKAKGRMSNAGALDPVHPSRICSNQCSRWWHQLLPACATAQLILTAIDRIGAKKPHCIINNKIHIAGQRAAASRGSSWWRALCVLALIRYRYRFCRRDHEIQCKTADWRIKRGREWKSSGRGIKNRKRKKGWAPRLEDWRLGLDDNGYNERKKKKNHKPAQMHMPCKQSM